MTRHIKLDWILKVAVLFCMGCMQIDAHESTYAEMGYHPPFSTESIIGPGAIFNLGPTGILAERHPKTATYKVVSTLPNSPANGRVRKGDVIYGVNGKRFADIPFPVRPGLSKEDRTPNPQLGNAVEESEGKDGRLALMIRRGQADITVTVPLKPLGRFSEAFPLSMDRKAEALAKLNARILAAKQLPDGFWTPGFAKNKNKQDITTCMAALALMARNNPEFDAHVHKAFNAIHGLSRKNSEGFASWRFSYRAFLFAEYYRRYKDPRALAALNELVNTFLTHSARFSGNLRGWGHSLQKGFYRYSGMGACTVHVSLAITMASLVGAEVERTDLVRLGKGIERIAPRGQLSYAWSPGWKGWSSTIDRTVFLFEEEKKGKVSQSCGRTGVALTALRLLNSRPGQIKVMADYLAMNPGAADCGHASGGSISWFWANLGLAHASPKRFAKALRDRIWYINMNRMHDGGFYRQPSGNKAKYNADSKLGPHFIAAANTILLSWHKHSLILTGAPLAGNKQQLYAKPVAPGGIYGAARDRVHRAVEAMCMLGDKTPQSVRDLHVALSVISFDSPTYNAEANQVYATRLEQALTDIAACGASETAKNEAALSLIGVSIEPSYGRKVKLPGIKFSVDPINYGKVEITCRLTKGGNVVGKGSAEATPLSSTEFSLMGKAITTTPKDELSLVTDFTWNTHKFTRTLPLNIAKLTTRLEKGTEKDYAPLQMLYGPFKGKVTHWGPKKGASELMRFSMLGNHEYEMGTANGTVQIGNKVCPFEKAPDLTGKNVEFYYYLRRKRARFAPLCFKVIVKN